MVDDDGPRSTGRVARAGRVSPFGRPRAQGLPIDRVAGISLITAFVVFLLVSATQLAPFREDLFSAASDGQGGGLRQITYILLVAVIVASARIYTPHRPLWPLPVPLTLLLAWCLLSTTWSLAPDITIRRLMLTVLVIYAMFQSVQALGYATTVKVLSYALLLILIANFASVAVVPGAIHRANDIAENALAGSWRGILTHKNMTGGLCALTVYMFLFEARQFSRVSRFLVVLASTYFLYRTQSKTSLGITGVGALAGAFSLFYSPRARILLVPVLVLFLAGAIAGLSLYLEPALRGLESSETAFTGRIQIWRVLIDFISDHPWLGSGYGAFWNIGPSGPVFARASGWVEHIIIGHSGYLDIAAQLGIPGMLLAVSAMMIIPLAHVFASQWMPARAGALLVALLVFFIGHNFTETSLLERDSLLAVTLALTVACVYIAIRDGRESAMASGMHPQVRHWNSLVRTRRN